MKITYQQWNRVEAHTFAIVFEQLCNIQVRIEAASVIRKESMTGKQVVDRVQEFCDRKRFLTIGDVFEHCDGLDSSGKKLLLKFIELVRLMQTKSNDFPDDVLNEIDGLGKLKEAGITSKKQMKNLTKAEKQRLEVCYWVNDKETKELWGFDLINGIDFKDKQVKGAKVKQLKIKVVWKKSNMKHYNWYEAKEFRYDRATQIYLQHAMSSFLDADQYALATSFLVGKRVPSSSKRRLIPKSSELIPGGQPKADAAMTLEQQEKQQAKQMFSDSVLVEIFGTKNTNLLKGE